MQVIHDEKDLRFYIEFEEGEAELTYTYPEEGVLDLDHTFVPEPQRGKGVADKLVKASMEFVKSKGYKFIPSCPAVDTYVKRHPEYKELEQEI
ncbi:GNAT family N-acetyltransferase [Pontibacter arcticus]|uniref:N-acetyltransferase n=1 Tax=Pontibacter arcticus TaxID=2080288 RepID=A0A364REN7_9BACT|nr:GNAT family N-acetyltransferase [Pontibacter arcticus]RAU82727.1 N-acetyltransferase [Pontibacter arcticus]